MNISIRRLTTNSSKPNTKSQSSKKDEKSQFSKTVDLVFEYILLAATVYAILWFVDSYFISFSLVVGKSMQPLFNEKESGFSDIVLVSRSVIHDFDLVRRGDVVVFSSTRDPSQLNIKRVIGLEGDVVSTVRYRKSKVTVPKGHVWLEGDNTNHSYDSNRVGPVPMGLIRGKATRIIWPPNRWKVLERKIPQERVELNDLKHSSDIDLENLTYIHDTPSVV